VVLDGHYEPERASEHRVQAAGDRHGSSALIDAEQTVLVAVCDHVRQLTVLTCTTAALGYRISSNRSRASNTGRGSDVIVLMEAGP